MTDKETFGEKDDMGVPGENIPGHLQDELHHGAAEITDMGDYGLSEEQKIALGIERMPEMPSAPADEPEAGEIVGSNLADLYIPSWRRTGQCALSVLRVRWMFGGRRRVAWLYPRIEIPG